MDIGNYATDFNELQILYRHYNGKDIDSMNQRSSA